MEREGVSCAALIAVIGKHWLTIADANGKRRLDDPNDILRREIVNALKRNVLVIPVLVGGAAMPSAEELPPDIAFLARRQALPITEFDFEHDIERLFRVLERPLCDETPTRQDSARSHEDERSQVELRSLLSQGKSAVARGDWTNAVQTLQAAMSLDPTNAEAAAELRNAITQRDLATTTPPPQKRGPSRLRWLIAGIVGAVAILVIIGAFVEDDSTKKQANIVDGPAYQQPSNAQPAEPADVKKQSSRSNGRPSAPAGQRTLTSQSESVAEPAADVVHEAPAEFRPPGRWRVVTATGVTAILNLFPDGSFSVMSGGAPLSAGQWSYAPQTRTVALVGVNNAGAYFSSSITIQGHDGAGFRAYDTYMGAVVLTGID